MNRETPAVNKTWAELKPGDEATLRRLCVADDFIVFAHASGNRNPIHLTGQHSAPAPGHVGGRSRFLGARQRSAQVRAPSIAINLSISMSLRTMAMNSLSACA